MARVLGFVIFLTGVIGLFVGFINSRIAEGTLPHTNFGPLSYTLFGPYTPVSALGIFGGTVATCCGLAMLFVNVGVKRS